MRACSARFAALLMATSALAVVACSNTESCRPGTLFVTVELGPYAGTADHLEVDVALEARGDAAAIGAEAHVADVAAGFSLRWRGGSVPERL